MSRLNVNTISGLSSTVPKIDVPAFSVYTVVTSSITNATQIKVPYDTVLFDTNDWFDTVNYRYVPQIAGYYSITITAGVTATNATVFLASVYKNGGAFQLLVRSRVATNISQTFTGSCLVYLNGSTDYVEGYIRIDGTSTSFTTPNAFNGFLVRAA